MLFFGNIGSPFEADVTLPDAYDIDVRGTIQETQNDEVKKRLMELRSSLRQGRFRESSKYTCDDNDG